MGFDTLSGFDDLKAQAEIIRNTPGIFKSEAERDEFFAVLQARVMSKKDEVTRLGLINELAAVTGAGKLTREALTAIPWVANIFTWI